MRDLIIKASLVCVLFGYTLALEKHISEDDPLEGGSAADTISSPSQSYSIWSFDDIDPSTIAPEVTSITAPGYPTFVSNIPIIASLAETYGITDNSRLSDIDLIETISVVFVDPTWDPEAQDLVIAATIHNETPSAQFPYTKMSFSFSLPIFTYDDTASTSMTAYSEQTHGSGNNPISGTTSLHTQSTSAVLSYSNHSTNTSGPGSGTLPAEVPNPASVIPGASISIAMIIAVVFFCVWL